MTCSTVAVTPACASASQTEPRSAPRSALKDQNTFHRSASPRYAGALASAPRDRRRRPRPGRRPPARAAGGRSPAPGRAGTAGRAWSAVPSPIRTPVSTGSPRDHAHSAPATQTHGQQVPVDQPGQQQARREREQQRVPGPARGGPGRGTRPPAARTPRAAARSAGSRCWSPAPSPAGPTPRRARPSGARRSRARRRRRPGSPGRRRTPRRRCPTGYSIAWWRPPSSAYGHQRLGEAAAGVEVGHVGVAALAVAGLVDGPAGVQARHVVDHREAHHHRGQREQHPHRRPPAVRPARADRRARRRRR